MTKENLPVELVNKHRQAFGLEKALIIENENDLFKTENPAIRAESAVIFLPKSKPLIDMTLALVSEMVVENGVIVLAGEKAAGIESAKKIYEKNIGPVEQKIVGNHSAMYVGKNKKLCVGKKIEDFISYFPISHRGMRVEIVNLPGVFSAGELDSGTKLLLDNIPYDKKNILDIGCGAGVVGCLYKKNNPESSVVMSDVSKLAVLASSETMRRNGLEAEIIESDVFENIKGKFDLVVSNPPFHKGVNTDYSFIEKFAMGAKSHLNKNGEVYVVANSFLLYKEILEKYIGPTEILIDDDKFRVFKSVL